MEVIKSLWLRDVSRHSIISWYNVILRKMKIRGSLKVLNKRNKVDKSWGIIRFVSLMQQHQRRMTLVLENLYMDGEEFWVRVIFFKKKKKLDCWLIDGFTIKVFWNDSNLDYKRGTSEA